MARIDGKVNNDAIAEGKTSHLCGSVPHTAELGKNINGDDGDISCGASQESGAQSSPCEPWLCRPHDRMR